MPDNVMTYDSARLGDYQRDEVSDERGPVDLPFLVLTLILLSVGVIMVLSASFARAYYDNDDHNSTYIFVRQLIFAGVGLGGMFLVTRKSVTISFLRRYSKLAMWVTVGMLCLVPLIGETTNGAKRWIRFGFFRFQPSEVLKLSLILFFASLICKYKDKVADKKNLLKFGLWLLACCVLIMLEKHMSCLIIVLALGLVMLYLGGLPLKWFIVGGLAAVLALVIGYFAFDHVRVRFDAWLDPFGNPSDDSYQIIQSLYAIGSGGLAGLGLGNSRQKYLYLPEEHNDFIFSIICEELGFIGASLILILFALLIIRGYTLSMHARDRYSALVAAGITTHFAIQVVLNVAVCTNSIPCTGISLPLFSYGGTALIMQLLELGIILSISRDIPEKT